MFDTLAIYSDQQESQDPQEASTDAFDGKIIPVSFFTDIHDPGSTQRVQPATKYTAHLADALPDVW